MKIKLLKTATGYRTITFDETKLIPDPKFSREVNWHDLRLDPKGENESEADYQKRVADHAAAVSAYQEQILREAQVAYEAEFNAAETVEVLEKGF